MAAATRGAETAGIQPFLPSLQLPTYQPACLPCLPACPACLPTSLPGPACLAEPACLAVPYIYKAYRSSLFFVQIRIDRARYLE
jgi:hypothetical protein